jgi:hypothetical protein
MRNDARPSAVRFDGDAAFDTRLLPELRAIPFFRLPTDEEVASSWAAYRAGDFTRLVEVWAEVAEPTRATLPGALGLAYDQARRSPRLANGHAFLASIRAVLEAGKRFRATLSPAVRRALETGFPWLEHRHEHIPAGWTPPLAFPRAFAGFIDVALDDARARWQLVCALNEVQQTHYSNDAARRFRLPELHRHAARERELALHYLSRWAPDATEALFRQCLTILDGLNAAVFDMMCRKQPAHMIARSLVGAFSPAGRAEWRAFVAALEQPQRLPG